MKPYLLTTGSLFALLALVHFAHTFAERARFAEDPWFWFEGPGLGLLAGALAFWAWHLLRRLRAGAPLR